MMLVGLVNSVSSQLSTKSITRGFSSASAFAQKPGVSHVKAPSGDVTLTNQYAGEFFETQAINAKTKDSLRAVHEKLNLDFNQLEAHSNAVACGYVENRIRRGDTVALLMSNESYTIATTLAAAKAGFSVLPLDYNVTDEQLDHIFRVFEPRAVVVDPFYKQTNYIDQLRRVLPYLGEPTTQWVPVEHRRYPNLVTVIQTGVRRRTGFYTFRDIPVYNPRLPSLDLRAKKRYGVSVTNPESGDPNLKLSPKEALERNADYMNPDLAIGVQLLPDLQDAVVFSQRSALNSGRLLAHKLGIRREDRLYFGVPLNKLFGLTVLPFASIETTAAMVLGSQYHDNVEALINAVAVDKATVLFAEPKVLNSFLEAKNLEKSDLTSLRLVVVVDDGTGGYDLRSAEEKLANAGARGVKATSVLASPQAGLLLIDGQLLPHSEAKLTDSQGSVVPVGSSGELKVKGFNTPKGTVTKKSKLVDADGFVNTGLKATLNSDGKFSLAH